MPLFPTLIRYSGRAERVVQRVFKRADLLLRGRRATIDGFQVLMPRNVMSDFMAHMMLQGGYEAGDRRLLRKYARPGDFVLDIGGGCGLTAMCARRIIGPQGKIVMIEPDSRLHGLAREHFRLNGTEDIESHCAAAVAERGVKEVTFYRSRDFWGSNIIDGVGRSPITVPAVYPLDFIPAQFPGRKLLFCDVEGYERTLLSKPELLQPFDLIFVELHFQTVPESEVSGYVPMFDTVFAAGFKIIDVDKYDFVFERQGRPAAG